MKKATPFFLILFGFLLLPMFHGVPALACMVIGIVMILNWIWPEKWGNEL